MTILTLIALLTFGVMVYAPLAAVLVEMFPARIRYTSLSLPHHVGNGWFGGFLPASVFAIVAAKGDMYAGLWYPIIIAAVSFLISGRDERCRHQPKRLIVTVSLYVVRYQEGKIMPFIQCDIRRGRSEAQKRQLFDKINAAVNRVTGAPTSSILILIREHAGNHFMEGGELLPDYVAGPNGEDIAGQAALRQRSS